MAQWVGQYPTMYTLVRDGPAYQGFRVPPMPSDGWILGINVAYDTWNSGIQRARFGLHDDQGIFMYQGSTFVIPSSGGPGRAVLYQHYFNAPIKVTAGQQIWPGIWHEEEMGFI